MQANISRADGILSKLRHNASFDFCLQVYYSIFYSHLTYGCNLWGLTSEDNITKLEVLRNKCICIMNFAPFDSSTNKIYIDLGLVKVRELISLNQLKIFYDFTQNSFPSDLMNLFNFSSDFHTAPRELNSIVNKLIYIPRVKTTTYGINSISYQWNKYFKNGEIKVDEDKKKNVKLSKIKTKKSFNWILKKHFLHSYTIVPTVIFY